MVLARLVAGELFAGRVRTETGGDEVVGEPVGALGDLAVGEATVAPHDAFAVGHRVGDGGMNLGEVELHGVEPYLQVRCSAYASRGAEWRT